MPSERDFIPVQRSAEYNIAGNVFRAWFDAQGKLAFVVDSSLDTRKPNALLVLDSDGVRKWDDILANDMGVDLETVRPRKDNKYQKLDIEYTGLDVYAALIDAYEDDEDLADALADLENFRVMSARRAANLRLIAAEDTIEKSRETIESASETIVELQERVRDLRGKLAAQRKSIGREPTKQSASKILRTEAQIDAANDKLVRAKKRLGNAQKRLDDAENDADVARDILAQLDMGVASSRAVAAPVVTDVAEIVAAPVPAEIDDAEQLPDVIQPRAMDLTITNDEQGALTMADENEEVKPLFDTDPEILDEEIAFKPIDFSAPVTPAIVPDNPVADVREEEPLAFEPIPTPLSFTAPDEPVVAPEMPRPIDVRPVVMPQPAPMDVMPIAEETTEIFETVDVSAPVMPVAPMAAPVEFTPSPRAAQPIPEVSPAPIDSGMRPVSPITGAPVAAVGAAAPRAQKPTVVYYLMLIALIVLSIFTLWLYQKNSSDATPDLAATVAAEEVVVADAPTLAEDVLVEEVEVVPEPVPVVTPEPEPVVTPEPTPVVVETPVVVAEPEPVTVAVAPIETEPVPVKPVVDAALEAEIIAKKPAYNVSQNENMFVAAVEYDAGQDVVIDDTPAPAVVTKPAVEYKEPTVVSAPEIEEDFADDYAPVEYATPAPTVTAPAFVEYEEPAPVLQEATSMLFPVDSDEYEEVETCADGNMPDINGCCTGEVFTDMEDGTFACCTLDGIDCFPPM